MIRAGLLGLGTIGQVHYEDGYKKLTHKLSLDACFDVVKENLDITEGARCYTDLDEFLKKEQGKLDFIDICLPTFLHKEVSIKAMEMGFNVLCEKPMALSASDAKEMYEASLRTGKKLMIAHVLRFNDDFEIIKKIIDSKELGEIRNVIYTDYRRGVPAGHNNWFKNISLSGGPVFDVHIHDTDALIWFFGAPEYITTISPKKSEAGSYDAFSTLAEYKKELTVNIHCDFTLPSVKHNTGRGIRLIFDKGYIIKNRDMFIKVDEEGKETDLVNERCKDYSGNLMYKKEIEYFADSLINNSPLSKCTPLDSVYSVRFVEAQIDSADKNGEKIKF